VEACRDATPGTGATAASEMELLPTRGRPSRTLNHHDLLTMAALGASELLHGPPHLRALTVVNLGEVGAGSQVYFL
jgi:hypothetical protein